MCLAVSYVFQLVSAESPSAQKKSFIAISSEFWVATNPITFWLATDMLILLLHFDDVLDIELSVESVATLHVEYIVLMSYDHNCFW